MAKKFSGTKLAHGKRAKTDPTFHYDPLDGLFNNQTNHNMSMWGKETVVI